MSKTVMLNGKQYSGVSQVELTTVAGETAVFLDKDNIVVPTGTLEITENGTYEAAGYESVTVNVPVEVSEVVINTDAETSIMLENNTEYRRGEIDSLALTMPEVTPEIFSCQVSFTSGATATEVTLPAGLTLVGDAVTNDAFTAQAEYRYTMLFWFDGELTWCAIYGVGMAEGEEEEPGGGGETGGEETPDTGTETGSGTESDPYIIASAAAFKAFADEVDAGDKKAGVYYKLTSDIDLAAYNPWNPIGANNKTDADASSGFAGVLDGAGHVIRNLNVSGWQYAGLFGSNFTGEIRNMGIESGEIATTVAQSTCGALARKATGSSARIVNCFSLIACSAVARGSGMIDELVSGAMMVGCYQAGVVSGSSTLYALKAASSTNGDIHYCLWDKDLTATGYSATTNATNNQGLTTAEFASAASILNANLSAVAAKAGMDVSKLCRWVDGSDGYPRMVVA